MYEKQKLERKEERAKYREKVKHFQTVSVSKYQREIIKFCLKVCVKCPKNEVSRYAGGPFTRF